MKIKKRFIAFALLVILFLCLIYFGFDYGKTETASAETIAVEQTEEIVETPTETAPTETEPEQVHTIWTRLEEWFSNNFLELIGSADFITAVGLCVSMFVKNKGDKKRNKETDEIISTNTAITQANTASNDRVLEVVNTLIEKQNEHEGKEENRDAANAQTVLLQKAILEILVAVYVNNKNLPQATKDLVNLKYVSALQAEAGTATGLATEAGNEEQDQRQTD